MTENTTGKPMYLVPGKLTKEQSAIAISALHLPCGSLPMESAIHAIGTPIRPCADVETVGYVSAKDIPNRYRYKVSMSGSPTGMRDTALVRRTDMEAQVAKIAAEMDAEIARLKENALPDQMTPDIEAALGIICFQAAPYAHAFRAVGADIPRKAEAEQAYVIFRLLKDVLRLGDFKKAFEALLEEARAAQKAGGAA